MFRRAIFRLNMKIGVLLGGVSSEHFISVKSGCEMLNHLPKEWEVFPIIITQKNQWIWPMKQIVHLMNEQKLLEYIKTPPNDWSKSQGFPQKEFFPYCDFMLLALHGGDGENGTIQKKLENYQQKYSGSGPLGCQNAMNKIQAKNIYQKNKIPTPPFCIAKTNKISIESLNQLKIAFPCFLKDPHGGSSLGVYFCENKESFFMHMKKFQKLSVLEVLVEEFILGREFSVGVVEGLSTLPVTEVCVKSEAFFNYKAKYMEGENQEITPAKLSEKQTQQLQKLAVICHQVLGLETYSRTDFLLKDEIFYAIETNNLPGMSKMSILPQQTQKIGIHYSKLIKHLIQQKML